MWNSSVEPMPSMMVMPVASFHSWRVAAGRASPALTHLRSVGSGRAFTAAAIAR